MKSLKQSLGGLRPSRSRGFTLIELMVSLVIVALLAGVGVPMYRSFILDQQLRAVSTNLRLAMNTARSEAVKRNRTLTLRANADGWSDGWTIPNPVGGEPDILNHKQTGNVSISVVDGPTELDFTPAGRVLAAVEIQIDAGEVSEAAIACLQLQLDGRAISTKGECPNG